MENKFKNKKQIISQVLILIVFIATIIVIGYINKENQLTNNSNIENISNNVKVEYSIKTIPEYERKPYVEINGNIPYFIEDDYTTEAFETYSKWDKLGKSGVTYAN